MSEISQRLIALLFVSGEAVSTRDLGRLLNVSAEEVAAAMAQALSVLDGSGMTLVVTADSIELTTAPSVAEFLAAYVSEGGQELTRAGAETLALLAYCGPLTRFEIDSLRGVDSRRTLRSLWRSGLIARQPAGPGRGRAALYSVSEEFLKGAGVTRREDLPQFAELSGHAGVRRLLGREQI